MYFGSFWHFLALFGHFFGPFLILDNFATLILPEINKRININFMQRKKPRDPQKWPGAILVVFLNHSYNDVYFDGTIRIIFNLFLFAD